MTAGVEVTEAYVAQIIDDVAARTGLRAAGRAIDIVRSVLEAAAARPADPEVEVLRIKLAEAKEDVQATRELALDDYQELRRMVDERDDRIAELEAEIAIKRVTKLNDIDPANVPDDCQIVPKRPTVDMLCAAGSALRRLIESVPKDKRAIRWGEAGPNGYRIPEDEKHAVRYQHMLLHAPKPSTSYVDRLADREAKLAAAEARVAMLEGVLRGLQSERETTENDIRWFSQNVPPGCYAEQQAIDRLVRDHKSTAGRLAAALADSPAQAESVGPKDLRHRERFKSGVRAAITWLHSRAWKMTDPHAQAVINSAAANLGWDLAADRVPEGGLYLKTDGARHGR